MLLASIHPTDGIAAHVGSGSVQQGGVMAEPADDGKEATHPAVCARASDKSQGKEDKMPISRRIGDIRATRYRQP